MKILFNDCQPKTVGFRLATINFGHFHGQHLEAYNLFIYTSIHLEAYNYSSVQFIVIMYSANDNKLYKYK